MSDHAAPSTPATLDVAAIEATWLQQCGPCDGGLPMGCVCSDADPRPVIASLLAALDEARAEVVAQATRIEDWRESARRLAARATAAESARDAAEGAIERVRECIHETIADLPEGREEWAHGAIVALRKVEASLPSLAPVTTDETEGGGVDE